MVLDQDASPSDLILALPKHLGHEEISIFHLGYLFLSGPVQNIRFDLDQNMIQFILDGFSSRDTQGVPPGDRRGPQGIPGDSKRLQEAQGASLLKSVKIDVNIRSSAKTYLIFLTT